MRTVKQILAADKEREKFYRDQAKQEAQNAMDVDGEPAKPTTPALDYVFYSTVEAPPSMIPQKKYCDITGLDGPYTHPTTGLRYHDKNIYEVVKSLNPAAQQAYLAARGLNTLVK